LDIFGSPVVENSHTGSIPVSLGLFPIFAGSFIEVIVFGSRKIWFWWFHHKISSFFTSSFNWLENEFSTDMATIAPP
jgi:hypothetical protein